MRQILFNSVVATAVIFTASCAWTSAHIDLPDGTRVEFWDNKSREGVLVSWEHTETGGYKVYLTSQKSGTEAEIAKIASGVTQVLDKAIDKVPFVPVP